MNDDPRSVISANFSNRIERLMSAMNYDYGIGFVVVKVPHVRLLYHNTTPCLHLAHPLPTPCLHLAYPLNLQESFSIPSVVIYTNHTQTIH